MKYTKKAYMLAEDELLSRRNKAESEQRDRFREVSAISPEIVDVDRRIKSINIELLKVITKKSKDIDASEMVMQIKNNNADAHKRKEEILSQIGYPKDYLDTKYNCEKCADRGYAEGEMCSCMKQLLTEYTFDELSDKCDIELHDFDEFLLDYYPAGSGNDDPRKQMSMILNRCISFANNFSLSSDSLFMLGNTGLGKTFLCSCIAKRVIEKGHRVVFRSVLNVFEDALSEHYGKKDGNTLGDIHDADLVILDDLGSEFSNQSDPILYQILNDRINLHRPTIITSNLSIPQFDKRYNERIVSRLFGEFELLPFVGNDIRIEKRDKI